jgi:hypothetical protein
MLRLKSLFRNMLGLVSLACYFSSSAFALDIQYSNSTANGCQLPDKAIVLSGAIEPGDNAKISAWLRQNTWYLIESNPPFVPDLLGGSYTEALKIADTFGQLYASVWLPAVCENSANTVAPKCSGACFALIVGAVNRLISAHAVGLFGPAFNASKFASGDVNAAKKQQQKALDSYLDWLSARRVPAALIENMNSHSSANPYWLSDQDVSLLPDISPEYERLIVERCDYQPGLLTQWVDANSSGKSEEAKRLREKWDKQSKCLQSMRADAREKWALP